MYLSPGLNFFFSKSWQDWSDSPSSLSKGLYIFTSKSSRNFVKFSDELRFWYCSKILYFFPIFRLKSSNTKFSSVSPLDSHYTCICTTAAFNDYYAYKHIVKRGGVPTLKYFAATPYKLETDRYKHIER